MSDLHSGAPHEHRHERHDARHGGAPAGAEELAARLRARGLRMTPQRQAVLDAVRRLGHATPDQVVAAAPDVDTATVYRNLELLEELGFVRHAHLGHGAASYRPAEDDHIHVVCHHCGRVVDAAPVLVDDLARRLHEANGFELDRSHFTVFGRCSDCVALSGSDLAADASGTGGPEQTAAAGR